MGRPIFLVGVFLLGCAAATVMAPLVVPRLWAATAPTRWEHLCVERVVHNPQEIQPLLDEYGSQGWQLGALLPGFYTPVGWKHKGEWEVGGACFKRPLSRGGAPPTELAPSF